MKSGFWGGEDGQKLWDPRSQDPNFLHFCQVLSFFFLYTNFKKKRKMNDHINTGSLNQIMLFTEKEIQTRAKTAQTMAYSDIERL